MKIASLDQLLEDELKDLFNAEGQLVKALPKMAKAASDAALKKAFTGHLKETKGQVDRLTKIGKLLGIKLSGKKMEKKFYKRFSRYPGGQKEVPFAVEMAKHPEVVVIHAVKNMLPRGTLGRQQITKLKVYKGTEHPHQAQQPKPLEIK